MNSLNGKDFLYDATLRGTTKADTIAEDIVAAGVTIDGVKLKDGGSLVVTGGTNTFNLTNGTASLNVAAGSAVDVNANLTVSAATTLGGTATSAEGVAGTDTTKIMTAASTAAAMAVVSNPKAMSQGVAMTYAASGSSGITVADNDNIDFGTGNFTLVWKGSLLDWTPSADQYLFSKRSGSVGAFYGYRAEIHVGGYPQMALFRNSAEVLFQNLTALTNTDSGHHETVFVITRETEVADGSIVCYFDGVAHGSPIVISSVNPPVTISGTGILDVSGASMYATRTASTTHHAYTFNRALTAAEVLDLYRNGIAESDKWGSQTQKLTDGAFENWGDAVTPTNWTKHETGTSTVNRESVVIHGGTYACRLDIDASASNVGVYAPTGGTLTYRKKYRLSLWAKCSAGSFRMNTALGAGAGAKESGIAALTLTTDWQQFSGEVTVTDPTTTNIILNRYIGEGAGQSIYIDDVELRPIGATLALEPEGIQPAPGQWLDASSNKLHALMPAAGATTTRPIRNGWADYTTGSTDQFLHGGTTRAILPAGNAIIEEIWAYSAGTPTFTLGDSAAAPATLVASITLVAATWTKLPLLKNSTTGDDIYWDVTAGGAATRFQIKYRTISLA